MDFLPGERVVWTGEPSERRLLRPEDGFLIPFSLVWGGFAVFWETRVVSTGAPGFFGLWGIPFVLIGLYLIAGRFVVRAVALRHTRYTVTDLRVVITGGFTGRAEYMEYLQSLPPPVVREREDGTGDLAFGSFPSVADRMGRRRGYGGNGFAAWGEPLTPPIFRGVASVRNVRDLVLAAQHTARR